MVFCVSYLRRMWREEPWGYPQRPQAAVLSLKFPAGVTSPALTRTYRLLFAVGWSFWVFYSVYGTSRRSQIEPPNRPPNRTGPSRAPFVSFNPLP